MLRRIGIVGISATGLLVWEAGCSAVLGIEDLGSSPPLGTAGSGNGGSSGADASATGGRMSSSGGVNSGGFAGSDGGASSGGRNAGGAGGSLPDASADGASGTDGGGSGGRGAGGAGGGTGGRATGGAGGTGDSGTSPVHGTVIDYWGHKIKNVVVTIGSTTVNTDANGAFTVSDVPSKYDVSLVVAFPTYQTTDGWIFQDLTRRDPTLQVFDGLEQTSGTTTLTVTGVTLPLTTLQTIGFSFGSPDGLYTQLFNDFDFSSGNSQDVYIYWWGTGTTVGTAHSLLWTKDATTAFPTAYTSYASHALTPNGTTTTTLAVSMAPASPAIAVGNVGGTVTSTATSRENAVYVRFTDGAAIQVVDDTSPSAAFLYKVPTLANGGITVAAVDGTLGYRPIGVSHLDDLAAGQTGVKLTTPTPPTLVGPIDGATGINAATTLTWTGTAGVFLLTINIIDMSSGFTGNRMYIVTDKKSAKLPSFPSVSFSIPTSNDCRWAVSTHGSPATVDDAAGPTGFIDQFAYDAPEGLRRGPGTFTESEYRAFTTAP